MLCAFVLVYLGDILQQNKNSRTLSPIATFGCRSCLIPKEKRSDLYFDIVSQGRFYYKHQRIRAYMDTSEARDINTKAKVKLYSQQFRMAPNPLALYQLSLALDIILSRPADPAHLEYNGLLQLLHNLLIKAELSLAAQIEYTKLLRNFLLLASQRKLQSPIYYLSSYTLSQHARWSILVAILLRVQLKDSLIQLFFVAAMQTLAELAIVEIKQYLQQTTGIDPVAPQAIVVRVYTALARNNINLTLQNVTDEQRASFNSEMFGNRRAFQGIIEIAAIASIKNLRSRQTTPTARYSIARAATAEDLSSDFSATNLDNKGAIQSEKTTYRSKEYRRNKAKPNVYIGLYFQQSINEYATSANTNVLASKDKYRKYKSAITYTNHANPERDLLTRDSLAVSVRLLL